MRPAVLELTLLLIERRQRGRRTRPPPELPSDPGSPEAQRQCVRLRSRCRRQTRWMRRRFSEAQRLPSTGTRHNPPREKKPSDAPSGEKNGLAPPIVPRSSRSCSVASRSPRMKIRRRRSVALSAEYASHWPSGETANARRRRPCGIGAANADWRWQRRRRGGRQAAKRANEAEAVPRVIRATALISWRHRP